MATTLKSLYSGQLAATAATLYTCPTATRCRVLAATACNDTTTTTTATLYVVQSGDTAGVTNLVVNAAGLASQEALTLDELVGHILEPGDFISGLAGDADQVTLTISGVEVT